MALNLADSERMLAAAKKAGRNAVLLEILRRGQPPAFIAIRIAE